MLIDSQIPDDVDATNDPEGSDEIEIDDPQMAAPPAEEETDSSQPSANSDNPEGDP